MPGGERGRLFGEAIRDDQHLLALGLGRMGGQNQPDAEILQQIARFPGGQIGHLQISDGAFDGLVQRAFGLTISQCADALLVFYLRSARVVEQPVWPVVLAGAQVLAISENAVKANLCIARRTIRAHMVQLEAREETR